MVRRAILATLPCVNTAPRLGVDLRTGGWYARPTMRRENLPALTSIRFFAAFWVVVFHVMPALCGNWPWWIQNVFQSGFVGVPLFFVLSGFILTYTYILPGEPLDARRFGIARFARVYPMHVVALILALPMFIWGGLKGIHSGIPWSVFTTPFLVQAWWPRWIGINTPSWSLSGEAFFYLLFPSLGVWFARRSSKNPLRWTALVWLVSLLPPTLYMLLRPDGYHPLTYQSEDFWLKVIKFNPLVRLPEFLMGIGLAQQFARMKTFRFAGLCAIGSGLAALLVTCFSPSIPLPYLNNSLLAPLFAVLVLALAFESPVSRALSLWPLVLLGEASYSLYILHGVLTGMIDSAFRHALPSLSHSIFSGLVQIGCVIAISLFTYKAIEVPARRWIVARFTDRLAPRAIPPAVPAEPIELEVR